MLRKLIKYDLKSMIKTMLPLWITAIVISLYFGIQIAFGMRGPMFTDEGWAGNVIWSIVLFSIFLAMSVLNILFVIQRFWNGLLKEEGYLMFTLPVSVRKLILSKMISALIISLISIMTAIVTIGIIAMGYLYSLQDGIYITGEGITTIFEPQVLFSSNPEILAGVLVLIVMIYHVYAAMAIGQLSNRNRFLCSFGAYIILNIGTSSVSSAIDNWAMDYLATNTYVFLSIIITIIWIFLLHFITEYLLTKKLNLE